MYCSRVLYWPLGRDIGKWQFLLFFLWYNVRSTLFCFRMTTATRIVWWISPFLTSILYSSEHVPSKWKLQAEIKNSPDICFCLQSCNSALILHFGLQLSFQLKWLVQIVQIRCSFYCIIRLSATKTNKFFLNLVSQSPWICESTVFGKTLLLVQKRNLNTVKCFNTSYVWYYYSTVSCEII